MDTKKDLIVSRMYQKGEHFLGLYVRELTGGEIDGSEFQFEVWKDNVEDTDARLTSGNIYFVQGKYFGKLVSLLEDGWKKANVGISGNSNRNLFNPEVL
jgi:hypothetical protein